MKTRHRIPAVFNLSMVDVLCCALGSVLLLWLLNSRLATTRAKEASKTRSRLTRVEKQLALKKEENRQLSNQASRLQALHTRDAATLARRLADKRRLEAELNTLLTKNRLAKATLVRLTADQMRLLEQLASLKKVYARDSRRLRQKTLDLASLQKTLDALKALRTEDDRKLRRKALELSDLKKALAALQKLQVDDREKLRKKALELSDLEKALAALKKIQADDRQKLRKSTLDLNDLLKQLAALKASQRDTSDKLRKKNLELSALGQTVASLKGEKADLEKRLKSSGARVLGLEREVRDRQTELARTRKGMAAKRDLLVRELDEARGQIRELERTGQGLRRKVARARAAAENRFAGISLTGKRVVFLVDMSGSMRLVDEKTKDPQKWQGVRDAVAKIMLSLPDLERFQVILFSNKVKYLLGRDSHWLKFRGKASADRVAKALAAVKPRGGTNMYAGFKAAFSFRKGGLDTVYVFSDGLPNQGPGLAKHKKKGSKLTENQRGEILSKVIRARLKKTWNPQGGEKRVKVNTVGFFYESPDVGAFLWALARENDGSFVGMSKP
jgi:hypothetical protein